MNSLSKYGLAAVIALGMGGVAISQDAGMDVDAGTDLEVQPGADLDAGADLGVDVMTTGSINSHANLASSIESATSFDIASYTADTTVNCVKVSTLEGAAGGDAQAIGSAATGNQALTTLRTDLQANTELMTDLETACQVAEFDVQDIVFVETGSDGSLVFYYDDSAA